MYQESAADDMTQHATFFSASVRFNSLVSIPDEAGNVYE